MYREFNLKCDCGEDLFVECEEDWDEEVYCPDCGLDGVYDYCELRQWESTGKRPEA